MPKELRTFLMQADGVGGGTGEGTTLITNNLDDGGNTEDNGDNGDNGNNTPNEGGQKLFTQEDVERIIKERLARERRKAEEKAEQARKEAERKALEEQQKYKELYEALLQDLQAEKQHALQAKKEALLAQAGYTQEQIERYAKYLEGETEEELQTALETLKQDIPPKGATYVDPAIKGNGAKQPPKQQDLYEYGKTLFERLKESGRLRK